MAVFDLELTISGLCVVVFYADQKIKPPRPTAVEILTIDTRKGGDDGHRGHRDHHHSDVHKPRLSLWAADANRWKGFDPYLHVAPRGEKQVTLDLMDQIVELKCGYEDRSCKVSWVEGQATAPKGPISDRMFDWVPSVESLGLMEDIRLPTNERPLPQGASSRLILPAGELFARAVAKDDFGEPIAWEFPAVGETRAIANEVVFRTHTNQTPKLILNHAQDKDENGKKRSLELRTDAGRTLYLDLSNDVEKMTMAHKLDPQEELHHLKQLENIALGDKPEVKPPTSKGGVYFFGRARTGVPLCDSVYFVKTPDN
jgi:hypothetical protein